MTDLPVETKTDEGGRIYAMCEMLLPASLNEVLTLEIAVDESKDKDAAFTVVIKSIDTEAKRKMQRVVFAELIRHLRTIDLPDIESVYDGDMGIGEVPHATWDKEDLE